MNKLRCEDKFLVKIKEVTLGAVLGVFSAFCVRSIYNENIDSIKKFTFDLSLGAVMGIAMALFKQNQDQKECKVRTKKTTWQEKSQVVENTKSNGYNL